MRSNLRLKLKRGLKRFVEALHAFSNVKRRGLGVCRAGHGATADPHPDARALLRVAVQANGRFARAHHVVVRARPPGIVPPVVPIRQTQPPPLPSEEGTT